MTANVKSEICLKLRNKKQDVTLQKKGTFSEEGTKLINLIIPFVEAIAIVFRSYKNKAAIQNK